MAFYASHNLFIFISIHAAIDCFVIPKRKQWQDWPSKASHALIERLRYIYFIFAIFSPLYYYYYYFDHHRQILIFGILIYFIHVSLYIYFTFYHCE